MNVDDEDNYELTTYSAGFYLPSDKVVRHYDVFDFEEAIEGAGGKCEILKPTTGEVIEAWAMN